MKELQSMKQFQSEIQEIKYYIEIVHSRSDYKDRKIPNNPILAN